MKLRIKGNSIRLRLTQSEVTRFAEKGAVEEVIKFGNETSAQMHYVLQKSESNEIEAYYTSSRMTIKIPNTIAENWAFGDQVGVKYSMPINEEENLLILVEKDFNCLKPRPHENEEDMFPHPKNGILEC